MMKVKCDLILIVTVQSPSLRYACTHIIHKQLLVCISKTNFEFKKKLVTKRLLKNQYFEITRTLVRYIAAFFSESIIMCMVMWMIPDVILLEKIVLNDLFQQKKNSLSFICLLVCLFIDFNYLLPHVSHSSDLRVLFLVLVGHHALSIKNLQF